MLTSRILIVAVLLFSQFISAQPIDDKQKKNMFDRAREIDEFDHVVECYAEENGHCTIECEDGFRVGDRVNQPKYIFMYYDKPKSGTLFVIALHPGVRDWQSVFVGSSDSCSLWGFGPTSVI